MPQQMPAVSLAAVPGRRRATLEAAREIERRGFAGIYAPSVFSNMSLCEALCHVTETITFATSIAPIYARTVGDFAQSAAFMHEVSGGRFRLGIGVSHAPAHVRMGVTPGKPSARHVPAEGAQLVAPEPPHQGPDQPGPAPVELLGHLDQAALRMGQEAPGVHRVEAGAAAGPGRPLAIARTRPQMTLVVYATTDKTRFCPNARMIPGRLRSR